MRFSEHTAAKSSNMLRFFSWEEIEKALISLAASMCEKNYVKLARYLH